MLNVKALSWALALTAAMAFCFYVAYGLLAPTQYNTVFGFPGFRWITFGRFLFGLCGAVVSAAFTGWVIGTLNNYFHRRWEMTHAH